jgi:hypothetical protein
VHDLQALRSAPHFAEATDARPRLSALLLLGREVEESQRQEARAVADPAQHLPAPAQRDLGELHLALHRGALSGAQLAERYHAGPVLVAQRQQEQQVLHGLDAERAQPLGQRAPTPRRDVTGFAAVTAR